MRQINRLTAKFVKTMKKPGLYADGGNLYLQVEETPGGLSKTWIFRFKRPNRPGESYMGLGPVSVYLLKEARELVRPLRQQLHAGIDPLEERKKQRAAARLLAAKRLTFKACAEAYVKAHSPGWRNQKHRDQWDSTLKEYAFPVIGTLPVQDVDTALVLKILLPIWTEKTETASRLRGRLEAVLDWATVSEFRSGPNPARWQGHLIHKLAKKSKVAPIKHHPALPIDDVPGFYADLQTRQGTSVRALEFLLLTAARTGAIIGATWEEIDLDGRVWAVPPERAGTKILGDDPKPRRVPLTDRMIRLLKSLPREDRNPHIFLGGRKGKGLSNMAMLELIKDMRPGFVPHGLRSSFKDWCSERTNFAREISEAALWHAIDDKVEAAYRRGELFEKRLKLMTAWGEFCAKPIKAGGADVLTMRGARASAGSK